MSIAVLLAEPNVDFAASMKENLIKNSISTEVLKSGQDWHSKSKEKNYSFIVLNYSLQNDSHPDFLKQLDNDHGGTIIFLAIRESERAQIMPDILEHKKVAKVLPFPYSVDQLLGYMNVPTTGNTQKASALHQKFSTIKTLTHKILLEAYFQGLNEQHIDYVQQICTSVATLIQKEKDMLKFLQEYEDYEYPITTHPFLVLFFSLLICKKLKWESERTINAIAVASLLHDIGMSSLPDEIRHIPPEDMTKEQFEIYQRHPVYGAEILQNFSKISAPVIQIVLQHHEKNGRGFPNQLSDVKIYPLAKLVSLSDHYVRVLLKARTTPVKGLKVFLADRYEILQYDPELVKALIKCFIKDDESKEK